jgi:hypothetical protein
MDWTAKQGGITEIRAPLKIDIDPTMVVGSDTTTTRPSTHKNGLTDRPYFCKFVRTNFVDRACYQILSLFLFNAILQMSAAMKC